LYGVFNSSLGPVFHEKRLDLKSLKGRTKAEELMHRRNRVACMRVTVYELASCLKGDAGIQICQSGAAMPYLLAPLLAANRLAFAPVIKFALQNSFGIRSAPPHIGVTEPFLVSLFDSLPI
jgi:hypothetical protein